MCCHLVRELKTSTAGAPGDWTAYCLDGVVWNWRRCDDAVVRVDSLEARESNLEGVFMVVVCEYARDVIEARELNCNVRARELINRIHFHMRQN